MVRSPGRTRARRIVVAAIVLVGTVGASTESRAQNVRSNDPPPRITLTRPREPGPSSEPPASPGSSSSSARRTLARPDAATDRERTIQPASPWWTLLALAFVVGLVLALARIWRKQAPGVGGGIPAEALEVLGRRPIGPRESMQLVRLGSRILVLGSGPEGLRTLAEIDDPIEVDHLSALCRAGREGSPVDSFRAWFRRAVTGDADSNEPVPSQARSRAKKTETTVSPHGDDELRRRLADRLQRTPPSVEEGSLG